MGSQHTFGGHRVGAEIVARPERHAGDRLEESLELRALERRAKLQIGKRVRARLKLWRRPHQLSKLEESVFVFRVEPLFFLYGALDRVQAVLRFKLRFARKES